MAFREDRGWIWQLSGAPGRTSEDGMLSPTPAPYRLWPPAWRPGSEMRGRAVGGDGSEHVGGVPVFGGFGARALCVAMGSSRLPIPHLSLS